MNSKEFKECILIYTDNLFRFSLSIVKNVSSAEDIVQEVLLKLWKKRFEIDRAGNIKSLTFTMIKNASLDYLRRNKVLEGFETVNGSLFSDSLENRMELKDKLSWVSQIIKGLPETQQMILHLKNIEGLSILETSKIMNMKENTVSQQLSRARKKIRESYKKIEEYGL
ncbi:MAG: RNA polymerase sigma factor [Bacteroidota bacterium]